LLVSLLSPPLAAGQCWNGGQAQGQLALTPNFLKPFILSSWSCISTSSCAETSAVEGPSESRPLLFRAMLPVWAIRRVLSSVIAVEIAQSQSRWIDSWQCSWLMGWERWWVKGRATSK
jgi:hypothetical protein